MSQINPVIDLSRDGDIAVVTVNSPPVNALSAAVRQGLSEAFRQTAASEARAVVLICDGRTFMAGADITEFGRPMAQPGLPELCDEIEASPKPVVAAIHGTALGGGLEVALCCQYRLAVPSARLGLPEVALGILPGAGGTQRLPRLVGAETALEMITSGRHVPAAEALRLGLVDALVEEGGLRQAAIAFARRVLAENRPLARLRDHDARLQTARDHLEIFDAFRKANARKFRGFKAPEGCIQAIEAAVSLPFDAGIAEERRLFEELVATRESAAQRYYFFAEGAAQKIPGLAKDTPVRPIRSVGIVGAGTMGGGIAMAFANAGIAVLLAEQEAAALERGLGAIRASYERTAARGGLTAEQVEQRIGLITGGLDLDAFGEVDLVIEAVFEQMEVKTQIFARLDAVCRPGAILATNTSGLDINEIAAATGRPQDVIGLHFFSPANIMKLLEVVRADHTADDVIATAMKLAKQIGKVAVLVGVAPGFVGNRMLAARQREADLLLLEGAMPWDVDRVLYGFGFPMGPFAMYDLAGLDIGWVKAASKGETVRDVLNEMDRRGQKTGAGYYDYDQDRKATPSPITDQVVRDFAARSGVATRPISDQEILERCLYPMINEGAKILQEGKAIRASDIDVVWVNGYGWPVYRGGPMFYGGQIGLDRVLARLQAFEVELGDRFKPAALLEKLVAEGRGFSDA